MVFCNLDYVNEKIMPIKSHNPYFNRWFSAIDNKYGYYEPIKESQSLF